MTAIPTNILNDLQRTVQGSVWIPSDPDFAERHRPWNRAVEQEVLAVVEAADAADIAALVRFARSEGLPIAAQPSGHGATGRAEGAILLRTGRLDSIAIDPDARTATIGAGVRSGDLQAAAAVHELTGLPGSSPVVTVAGTVLGGGLSWFGRSFGWVSDSVLAFDVVDGDGRPQHVSADSDAELFWALRGGGSEVAIVTAMTVHLHEAPDVFGGRQLWAGAHAREVAEAFRTLTSSAPDQLSLWLELLNFPGADPMVAIDSTYLGPKSEALELMRETDRLPAPLSDTRAVMSVAELGSITAEPTDPVPGSTRAELLTSLEGSALDPVLAEPIDPLLSIQIRHLGGALARPSDGPHGGLVEPYSVYMFGLPTTPATARSLRVKQDAIARALSISGRKPVTFLNPSEHLSDALNEDSMARLRELKTKRDPQGIFRGNFSTLDRDSED